MANYVTFILSIAAIYALLAMALTVIWGQTGIVNLGLAGFVAVGAYTSALATTVGGLPLYVGIPGAAIVAAVCGLLLARSTRSLRDDYLAVVTLGFGESIRIIASNERWLTNGTDGISGLPGIFQRSDGNFELKYLIFLTAAVAITWALIAMLARSPWGRTLRAIRDDQVAASVAGKPVEKRKEQAFVIGCAVMGFAGALYAHFTTYIAPDIFQPTLTIYIFLAATIGGVSRPIGAVLGGYVLVAWLEASRFLGEALHGFSAVQLAAVREIGVGLALLLIMIFFRGGLFRDWHQKPPSGRPD